MQPAPEYGAELPYWYQEQERTRFVESQPDPLTPELREAESLMEEALTEACATPPPSKVDTGELIRIEEMLEIATDAAKRAVALRRRRREARKRSGARGGAELGAAEAAASPSAAHRSFSDERGVTWDVYAVYPEPSLAPKLRGSFQHGWLCFDSGPEKRRLSPVPSNWQELGEDELKRLADQAERARVRRGRPRDDDPGPADTRPPAAE
jgi:hypothetical protein